MRINHNISALRANNQLKRTNSALDKSIEKLTSGYRINKAADDAAGLAISQKMKTQIRGLDQASRNASDGISLIQTAEGALNEVEAMLQRMRELSVQAANGTNTDEDREAIQSEIDQLNEEIDRISDTTEFNTKVLLNGEVDRKSYSDNAGEKLISLTDEVEAKGYKVTVTQKAAKASVSGATGITNLENGCMKEEGKLCINGQEITINKGEKIEDVYEKLRDLGDSINVEVSYSGGGDIAAGKVLKLETKEYGSKQKIEIYSDNKNLLTSLGLSQTTDPVTGKDAKIQLTRKDTTNANNPNNALAYTDTTTTSADGNKVKITDKDGFKMVLEIQDDIDLATAASATITVLEQGPVVLQIGANEGQTVKVSIPEVSSETLGVSKVNISTEDGAQEALGLLDEAINTVSSIRAKLGAYQNRLDHAIANLDTTSENMSDALSRIEDVDMAEEMSTYTQKNVLAQAGTSMLSQANERPQTVLSLLQG